MLDVFLLMAIKVDRFSDYEQPSCNICSQLEMNENYFSILDAWGIQ